MQLFQKGRPPFPMSETCFQRARRRTIFEAGSLATTRADPKLANISSGPIRSCCTKGPGRLTLCKSTWVCVKWKPLSIKGQVYPEKDKQPHAPPTPPATVLLLLQAENRCNDPPFLQPPVPQRDVVFHPSPAREWWGVQDSLGARWSAETWALHTSSESAFPTSTKHAGPPTRAERSYLNDSI